MSPGKPDLKQVLLGLKDRIGGNEALAEALGYSDHTIRDWLGKNDDELDRLALDKKKCILTLAEDYGIEPYRHIQGPTLWDAELNFERNSQRPLPEPPPILRPLIDHKVSFLGSLIGSPLGVGPSSLTSNVGQVRFWGSSGVDVITLRTVKSSSLTPAGRPNLHVAEDFVKLDGDRAVDVELAKTWDSTKVDNGVLSLFLGSSPAPSIWQANFRAANLHLSGNQLLILSVIGMGTNESDLITDWETVSRLGAEAGARVIELNLSVPKKANDATAGEKPLCFDLDLTAKVCAAVRSVVGESVKILMKIRWMPRDSLLALVEKTIANGHANGVSAVSAEGVRAYVRQGSDKIVLWNRQVSIGGKPLFALGLQCVSALAEIRAKLGLEMGIVGLGGVSNFDDFLEYRRNGADVVQVVSKCFADSYFPYKLRKALDAEERRLSRASEHEHDVTLMMFAKAVRVMEQWPEMTQTKKEKVQKIAQVVMVEWMRRRQATSDLGPTRSKPLTLEECVRLIQQRLI